MPTAPSFGFVPQKNLKSSLSSALSREGQPFYATKLVPPQISHETLKRSRSLSRELGKPTELKSRRLSPKEGSEEDNQHLHLLPNNKDFEEAILTVFLGPINGKTNTTTTSTWNSPANSDRRLKVFWEIALSASPKACARID